MIYLDDVRLSIRVTEKFIRSGNYTHYLTQCIPSATQLVELFKDIDAVAKTVHYHYEGNPVKPPLEERRLRKYMPLMKNAWQKVVNSICLPDFNNLEVVTKRPRQKGLPPSLAYFHTEICDDKEVTIVINFRPDILSEDEWEVEDDVTIEEINFLEFNIKKGE